MYTTINHSQTKEKSTSTRTSNIINRWIEKNEVNYFGLSALFLGVGTGFASLPVAIAIHLELFVLAMISVVFAMTGLVTIISQQPFKTITWAFLIGAVVNAILCLYLIGLSLL
jgi:hypothetical protein